MRWNGAIGDFTSLEKRIGAEFGVKDGDVVEATVEGNVLQGIRERRGGHLGDRRRFQDGAPGVGFNFFVGDTNVDHGFTSFEVETWDD